MDILDGLNEAQRSAVTETEGYVRVLAGAGSGKTRALAHRFAYLVNELGIMPGNILCVTFTNKSAAEMRRRIRALTGDNDTGYISTFHSFCVSVLQEDSYAIQYPKSFLVLDNADIDAMLRTVYEERGLTLRDMTFADARDMIEMRKNKYEPFYYLDLISMTPETLHRKYSEASEAADVIFYGYLCRQKKCFGLDYNDLINFTLYIFSQSDEIKLKWQKRLEYIMIDEFQDIDDPQYRLMEALCAYHGNLFVVGDPDQTIYTWRGAKISFLLDFDKRFPTAKTIMMMQNYRSTPQILAAANSLISKNKGRIEKDLLPTRPSGAEVLCLNAKTTAEEADAIASRVLELHGAGEEYRSMAVLYRAHYVSRSIEEALLREKIPYTIYSGVQFFCRAEIKDALSYLRLLAYRDDLSFARVVNVPKRNIGKGKMKLLTDYAEARGCSLYEALCENAETEHFRATGANRLISLVEELSREADKPVSEMLTEVLTKSGYEELLRTEGSQERLDNLAELKQSIYEYEASYGEECTLEHYLSHVALLQNTDTAESDRVRLMTVHAAKGLEFPNVFLCGMNEGLFPSKKTNSLQGMEEERRLAFVALTRARDRLFISSAEVGGHYGAPRYPSRFILDIDEGLLTFEREIEPALASEARRYIERTDRDMALMGEPPSLSSGDRVAHSVFGPGTILAVDSEKHVYSVQFDDMDTPRSISFRVKLIKL